MSSLSTSSAPASTSKERYVSAQRHADHTIDQDWSSYSPEEHSRWDRLFARAQQVLPGRASQEFMDAMNTLQLSQSGVPNMERLSDRLGKVTGWRVVPVHGLVPDDVFFDHLANKRFPAGAFIRSEAEMDYLEEPDIFHDIFGHVPLLANPAYSDFIQAYGKGGQRALTMGRLANLARLYWYTVEFGLIRSDAGLRIFGAGIMSSAAESVFCLEDPSPNRVSFDLERVMRTRYIIDDFQQTYFVIDGFEKLLDDCYGDFTELYGKLASASDLEAHEIIASDEVLHRGSMKYFRDKRAA